MFEGLVRVEPDAEGFVAAVEESLRSDGPEERAERVRFAHAHRPEVRAREKVRRIEALLGWEPPESRRHSGTVAAAVRVRPGNGPAPSS